MIQRQQQEQMIQNMTVDAAFLAGAAAFGKLKDKWERTKVHAILSIQTPIGGKLFLIHPQAKSGSSSTVVRQISWVGESCNKIPGRGNDTSRFVLNHVQ